MKAVVSENNKGCAPRRNGILPCAIGRAKKVAVSESREITWVAYLGQITNIGSSRARNYKSRAPRRAGILVCASGRAKKGCCLKIARNCTGSIFTRNNEYWNWSSTKTINGSLPGGLEYERARLDVRKRLSSRNRVESHG